MFLLRETNWFKCNGVRRHLRSATVYPADENVLSDGTDVAGIAKYLSAMVFSSFMSFRWCQYWIGSSFKPMGASFKYV